MSRLQLARVLAILALALMAGLAHGADMNKTVRFAFRVAETGFDPAQESDRYSNYILLAIFDPLLTYDYLARPVKLKPNTTVAMPEVADNGATYTFHIKPGIYYSDHPAFKGVKRELNAQDYAYSLRRFFDPEVKSPNLYFFEGKIIGADEVMAKARKNGKYDYDAPIEGLQVLDRYTLRIKLKEPDYNFQYIMAMTYSGAVAREVVEYYGSPPEVRSNPVGTGAFVLKEWRRSSKIVLEANQNFREEYFEATPEDNDYDRAIVENLKGKRLPISGRVEVSIIEEPQPRWIAFVNNEFDYIEQVHEEFLNKVAPGGKLAPSLAKRGVIMQREPQMEITITAFYNLEDPVIGGYTPEKIALRRAMNLAYNGDEEVSVARNGQAIRAETLLPPGLVGYDPSFHGIAKEFSLSKAKALLDLYGYIDRDGDGYRELPDGKKLELEFGSTPDATLRPVNEVWKKSMDALGVNIKFRLERWPDLNKAGKAGTLQVGAFYAWGADYPDGDNFFQLLYGPNTRQSNYSNFNLPAFDKLYEKARRMPDSPERTQLYNEMSKLFFAYAPWRLGVHRIWTNLAQPWLKNYKKHPVLHHGWKYLDVDVEQQRKAQ
jgi:oligopeptide transport system substrate-binding protein